MTAILTSPEELREIVTSAVHEALENQLLTTTEVAEFLGITRDSVGGLVRNNNLPGRKVGRDYRFRRADVEAWLDSEATRPGSRRKAQRGRAKGA